VEELQLVVDGVPVLADVFARITRRQALSLVVQTQGSTPSAFSMDGRNEWSSGLLRALWRQAA